MHAYGACEHAFMHACERYFSYALGNIIITAYVFLILQTKKKQTIPPTALVRAQSGVSLANTNTNFFIF